MKLGVFPGRYPAVVVSYDPGRRTCRVDIPGISDGGDVHPEAEIEYSIGDKSRDGSHATEIEILPGDTVWVAFIAGDPRYPIITGYRNPQAGNSQGWRRWHHANIEVLSDMLMRLISGGDFLIKSGSHVTIQAPSVTVDSSNTDVTGNLNVKGKITGSGGMAISGGDGAQVEGNVRVKGDMHSTGSMISDGPNSPNHRH